MKTTVLIIAFVWININTNIAQKPIEIIKSFELASQNNLSFQNGLNTFITTPGNDIDALRKGFETCHTDQEQNGGWHILGADWITVDNQKYRAILYSYQNKKHIALHYKIENDKYFFRIFNPTYGQMQ